MPQYMAKANLIVNGEIFFTGDLVALNSSDGAELVAADKAEAVNKAEEIENDDSSEDEQSAVGSEDEKDLADHTVDELQSIAKEQGMEGYSHMKKQELIDALKG